MWIRCCVCAWSGRLPDERRRIRRGVRGQRDWSTAALFGCVLALWAAAGACASLAYITNQGSNDVSVVDLVALRVVQTIAVGRSPAGVAVSAPAGRAYISNPDSRDISVIDLQSRKQVATVAGGSGPVGIAVSPDGRRLYAADWYADVLRVQHSASLSVIDLESLKVVATWAACEYPEGIEVSGDRIYVVSWMEDALCVHDAKDGTRLGSVALGRNPRGFGRFLDAR
jgi:YVTN family beta-propeller protein